MLYLSPHFTLHELVASPTGLAHGLANLPSDEHVENLRALCENILEPLRARLDRPLHVNSGYRGPALNKLVGGQPDSQHLVGEAADIVAPPFTTRRLRDAIVGLGLPFDQLILEHHDPAEPFSGWVHVSHRRLGKNRRMSFEIPGQRAPQ